MKKKTKSKSLQSHRNNPNQQTLRFSPTAWAKLLYFRDRGDTEISGFGISGPDDLLYVADFITIKQDATATSISLDDEAVANFFEDQIDAGRKPEQFFRVWCHTHPGSYVAPSGTDEDTFARVFGKSDWAIMVIVAETGQIYARLCFNTGPGGQMLIPVEVDYSKPFGSADQEIWEAEYNASIKPITAPFGFRPDEQMLIDHDDMEWDDYSLPQDIIDQLENMEPEERQAVLDELAIRHDLWDQESEAIFYE